MYYPLNMPMANLVRQKNALNFENSIYMRIQGIQIDLHEEVKLVHKLLSFLDRNGKQSATKHHAVATR